MFALTEGILLRSLAVPNEGQLVVGWRQLSNSTSGHWPFRTMDIDTLRAGSRRLESIAGVGYNDPSPLALVDGGSVTFVQGARVGGDFFRVLGAGPALGRTLTARDDVAGAENVLVITHGLWQRRYGASRDVIGRRLTFGGQPFTIVGVMPADVEYPRGVEVWATIAAMQTTTSNPTFRNAMRDELDLVARMRPGATLAQSAAELRIDGANPGSAARTWRCPGHRAGAGVLQGVAGGRRAPGAGRPVRRGRTGPLRRLRERGQPDAIARRGAARRVRGASRARRQPRTHGASDAAREPDAGGGRRRRRMAGQPPGPSRLAGAGSRRAAANRRHRGWRRRGAVRLHARGAGGHGDGPRAGALGGARQSGRLPPRRPHTRPGRSARQPSACRHPGRRGGGRRGGRRPVGSQPVDTAVDRRTARQRPAAPGVALAAAVRGTRAPCRSHEPAGGAAGDGARRDRSHAGQRDAVHWPRLGRAHLHRRRASTGAGRREPVAEPRGDSSQLLQGIRAAPRARPHVHRRRSRWRTAGRDRQRRRRAAHVAGPGSNRQAHQDGRRRFAGPVENRRRRGRANPLPRAARGARLDLRAGGTTAGLGTGRGGTQLVAAGGRRRVAAGTGSRPRSRDRGRADPAVRRAVGSAAGPAALQRAAGHGVRGRGARVADGRALRRHRRLRAPAAGGDRPADGAGRHRRRYPLVGAWRGASADRRGRPAGICRSDRLGARAARPAVRNRAAGSVGAGRRGAAAGRGRHPQHDGPARAAGRVEPATALRA